MVSEVELSELPLQMWRKNKKLQKVGNLEVNVLCEAERCIRRLCFTRWSRGQIIYLSKGTRIIQMLSDDSSLQASAIGRRDGHGIQFIHSNRRWGPEGIEVRS